MADSRPDDAMSDDDMDAILDGLGPASEMRGAPGHDLAQAAARRTRAVTMRLAGMTYEQVAAECGYSTKDAARQAVLRALSRIETERVEQYRTLENARLDRAQAAIWPKVIEGNLHAVEVFLRLSARRARMNNLDPPQALSISTPDRVQLEAMITDFRQGIVTVLGEVEAVSDERYEE